MPAPKGKKYAQRAPKQPNTEPGRAARKANEAKKREIQTQNALRYGAQKPKFDDGRELAYRIACYIHRQHVMEEPCTVSGLAIACGTTSNTIGRYRNHEVDGIEIECEDRFIDQIDDEETLALYTYLTNEAEGVCGVLLSSVIEMADEILRNEREVRLYKQGRVADIFALKAQDGWQDDRTPHTVNQTLVINGNEQSAESALAQLGFGRLTDGK